MNDTVLNSYEIKEIKKKEKTYDWCEKEHNR
jgi:hypothetical protein